MLAQEKPTVTEQDQLQSECKVLLHKVSHPDFRSGFAYSPYETLAVILSNFDQAQLGPDWAEKSTHYLLQLATKQQADGSWGSDPRVDFLPDKIITTLAATLALRQRSLVSHDRLGQAIDYVVTRIPDALLLQDSRKTIAFDLLAAELLGRLGQIEPLPTSITEALSHTTPVHILQKIDHSLSKKGTVHSILDAISSFNINWELIASFQEPDGSMGIYPSSTATLLANLPPASSHRRRGIEYLRRAMNQDGTFPPFYPSEEFERWWAIQALAQSPASAHLTLPLSLASDVPEEGLSVSASFSLPDVDTASMKAVSLSAMGHQSGLGFLNRFYRNGVFTCYEHEARTSPSANIHALMALCSNALASHRRPANNEKTMFASALGYLLEATAPDGCIADKWHMSDLYATCHFVELLVDIISSRLLDDESVRLREAAPRLLNRSIEFIIGHQSESDGGFKCALRMSTVEETSYAVRALCKSRATSTQKEDRPLFSKLHRAGNFLRAHPANDDPPLWLGKTLYQSLPIIQANQLSALLWLRHLNILDQTP